MTQLHSSPVAVAASIAVLLAAASLPAQASGATTQAPRKPHDSGVGLTYRIDATPQLGSVTDVNGAAVRLSTDPGLSIQGNRTLALPAGKKTAATVFLVSESEGLSYLHVFITQGGGMSAISVPIQTGTTAALMKPSGELKQNARGDKIISMPAR
jgi:hypothetical protein